MPHQSKKKLRQTYIQVCDALGKTGSSGKEKDTFIWFDKVDKISGTKPVVDPVDIVENGEGEPVSPTADLIRSKIGEDGMVESSPSLWSAVWLGHPRRPGTYKKKSLVNIGSSTSLLVRSARPDTFQFQWRIPVSQGRKGQLRPLSWNITVNSNCT